MRRAVAALELQPGHAAATAEIAAITELSTDAMVQLRQLANAAEAEVTPVDRPALPEFR